MKLKTFFENMKPFREVSELYISKNKRKTKQQKERRKDHTEEPAKGGRGSETALYLKFLTSRTGSSEPM
jgi:hypothetical protein